MIYRLDVLEFVTGFPQTPSQFGGFQVSFQLIDSSWLTGFSPKTMDGLVRNNCDGFFLGKCDGFFHSTMMTGFSPTVMTCLS